MLKPLIPDTNVFRAPLAKTDISALKTSDLIRIGAASKLYRYHWNVAAYTPYPKQQMFHDMPKKFRAMVGGIGSGKSKMGAAETVKQAIEQPGSVGIVAAPTYKMLNSSTKPTLMDVLNPDAIHRKNENENIVDLTNGTRIYFRSTENPEFIRGIDAVWFWLDEGSYSTGKSWDILVGRLRKPGFKHRGWVTTTPKGKNWLWLLFASPDAKTEQYDYIQVSSRDNPYLPPDFVRTLELTYGNTNFAKQEIEGHFTAREGLVYPEFDPLIHTFDPAKILELKESFRDMLYGVDFGFENRAAIVACALDGDKRMYVVEEWTKNHALDDELIVAAKEMVERWGSGKFVCDPSEAGSIQKFNNKGLPAIKGNNAIVEGIKEVSARLIVKPDGRPRLFVNRECSWLLHEFTEYHYPEQKEGKPIIEKPEKIDDHLMDALRYAAMACRVQPWTTTSATDAIFAPRKPLPGSNFGRRIA